MRIIDPHPIRASSSYSSTLSCSFAQRCRVIGVRLRTSADPGIRRRRSTRQKPQGPRMPPQVLLLAHAPDMPSGSAIFSSSCSHAPYEALARPFSSPLVGLHGLEQCHALPSVSGKLTADSYAYSAGSPAGFCWPFPDQTAKLQTGVPMSALPVPAALPVLAFRSIGQPSRSAHSDNWSPVSGTNPMLSVSSRMVFSKAFFRVIAGGVGQFPFIYFHAYSCFPLPALCPQPGPLPRSGSYPMPVASVISGRSSLYFQPRA